MHISRIKLNNLRGFEGVDISLDRGEGHFAGWTVFTGDNGSGKSTLLKAVAIALAGTDTARALQPSFGRWIRERTHEATIELEVVQSVGDDSFADVGRSPAKGRFPVVVSLTNGTREPSLSTPIPKSQPKNYVTPQRSVWASDAPGWFACGYGPFRRVFGASPEATRTMVAPSTGRFVTMFQEAASLAEVDQWLRNLHHKSLEKRALETTELGLVLDVLRSNLLPNQITVDRIDSDGLWLKDRTGLQLSWHEMSDGYRAALALMADILRHLLAAYGPDGLITANGTSGPVIQRSGVVLIDEVDAHLHPEWQREIGFWLKERFPRIQFLVTSHSPLICQAADENGIFVLPEPGSGSAIMPLDAADRRRIIASGPDVILRTPAFGLQNTRSSKAVEARAQYGKLRAKQRAGATLSAAESQRMDQLTLFVLPESDAEHAAN
jgi:energy-coupling factor transporter ATP-binding protein EcfA2